MPVAELQAVIVIVALTAGALRGFLGFWFTAPEGEPWTPNKILKTMTRYAIFNIVIINSAALAGVTWTPMGIMLFTFIQIAPEIGWDQKKA